jgi:hypothetical protein
MPITGARVDETVDVAGGFARRRRRDLQGGHTDEEEYCAVHALFPVRSRTIV